MTKKVRDRKERKKNFNRKFYGKLDGFTSKEEQRREQKHLRAYLKGRTSYIYGYREMTHPVTGTVGRVPNVFPVLTENG